MCLPLVKVLYYRIYKFSDDLNIHSKVNLKKKLKTLVSVYTLVPLFDRHRRRRRCFPPPDDRL